MLLGYPTGGGVEAQVDDVEGGELRFLGTVRLRPWVEHERDHVALEGAVEGDPVGPVVPSDFATNEDSSAGSGGGEEGVVDGVCGESLGEGGVVVEVELL